VIESRERQRTRSLEEDKSRTPHARTTARHIRDKTMHKQRAQTTKAYKSSPCTYANPHEQVPTLGKNRSGRFPKLVRPISCRRPHLQKPKMQKKCTSYLDSWDRFQGCNATFLHLSFSPLLPMHESWLKFENKEPRASQVYKIHHKILHMSNGAS
jgi:hypothetical protein